MLEHDTNAIVLSKETIGETDAQISLYTEVLGKIDLVAKGIKKPTAKLSHHLEPINLVVVNLISANNRHLTSALTINHFPSIRSNQLSLAIALRNLKILKQGIIQPEKDEFLWSELLLFLDDLEALSNNEKKQDSLILLRSLHFIKSISKAVGVLPDFIEDLENNKLTSKSKQIVSQLINNNDFDEKSFDSFSNNIYNEVEPFLKNLIFQAHS